jgi:hypothetical protein
VKHLQAYYNIIVVFLLSPMLTSSFVKWFPFMQTKHDDDIRLCYLMMVIRKEAPFFIGGYILFLCKICFPFFNAGTSFSVRD